MGCYLENYLKFEEDGISFPKEKAKFFFNAYLSIKDKLNWVKQTKIGSTDAYLISKKSVEKFMNILINSGVLKKICQNNILLEEEEKKLITELEKYNLEKNIKILTLENIKNRDDNEFIVVDDKFIESMQINTNKDDYLNKKVEIIIDNINSYFRIKINHKNIFFNKVNYGFYRFCSKEETNDIIKCIKYNNLNNSSSLKRYYNGLNSRTVISGGSNEEYDFLSFKVVNVVETKKTL